MKDLRPSVLVRLIRAVRLSIKECQEFDGEYDLPVLYELLGELTESAMATDGVETLRTAWQQPERLIVRYRQANGEMTDIRVCGLQNIGTGFVVNSAEGDNNQFAIPDLIAVTHADD